MKAALIWFRRLPLTWRVPITVAALMIAVSAVISERVLDRLAQTQEEHLLGLASSYLDGVVASISPSVLRQDSWEVYDAIVRVKPTAGSIVPLETVVATEKEVTLASDSPTERPTLERLPETFLTLFPNRGVAIETEEQHGYAKRVIDYQGQPIGTVFVIFDVSSLLAERRKVLLTLLITNGLLTALVGLIGFVTVRHMVKPMQILESHMTEAASGTARLISANELTSSNHDARKMFHAYNALVAAENERKYLARQLAEEDKLASLGRLASGMAHEINNPLGGLMNAVDTLRKHGTEAGVRDRSLDLIQRGLQGIRDVVEATLATYRRERSTRPLSVQDFEDLKLLLRPELERKHLTLRLNIVDIDDGKIDLPAGPVRQAVLNLLLNACSASPPDAEIGLEFHKRPGAFVISVSDQAKGLPVGARQLLVSGSTSQPPAGGNGLGLWVVRRVAEELGAKIEVSDNVPHGTIIRLTIVTKSLELVHAA